MKRIIAACLVAALAITIFSPSVQDALVMFVVAGSLPGSSWQIPPANMIAGLSLAMAWALHAAFRQTRAIQLPPLETSGRTASRSYKQRSVWRRRNAFRPQLKFLQQKLVVAARVSSRIAVQLQRKFWQVCLQARSAVRLPTVPFGFGQALRKVTGFVPKK